MRHIKSNRKKARKSGGINMTVKKGFQTVRVKKATAQMGLEMALTACLPSLHSGQVGPAEHQ